MAKGSAVAVYWLCCSCGDGPWEQIFYSCHSCNNHWRCDECRIEVREAPKGSSYGSNFNTASESKIPSASRSAETPLGSLPRLLEWASTNEVSTMIEELFHQCLDLNAIQFKKYNARIRGKLQRELERMAFCLEQESANVQQRQISALYQTYSASISESIIEKIKREMNVAIHDSETVPRQSNFTSIFEWSSEGEEGAHGQPTIEGIEFDSLPDASEFIIKSTAYMTLRDNLQDYLNPTLSSLLSKSVKRWKALDKRRWGSLARRLVAELDEVDYTTVHVFIEVHSNFLTHMINTVKGRIESWTRQEWNWWPLRTAPQQGILYMEWKCRCGDWRAQIVPDLVAVSVTKCCAALATAGGTQPGSLGAGTPVQVPSHSRVNQATHARVGPKQGRQISQGPSNTTSTSNVPPLQAQKNSGGWVMMVVKSRGDFHLAQLNVQGISSLEFFRILRSEYFRLRGLFARYLSVWGFSHCDFFEFEKYDEGAVAPRRRDRYPDPNNSEYEYAPKTINIPPITRHEFKKRFDTCGLQPFHFRCHKKCPCVKIQRQGHNREIITLLPKKVTQLDGNGDQREIFWGLYAQQQIYFWRVLAYNMICTSPLTWFFFMWLFYWGHDGDMQNASVPLMVMMSLLSIFWATFITSLRQGDAFT